MTCTPPCKFEFCW